MPKRPTFQVAAGVLQDAGRGILITERRCDGPFNGLWEFPGGKLAPGESGIDALERELREELGIDVTGSEPLVALRHEYPDRNVELEFFLVTAWSGEPRGCEGQQLRWVARDELHAVALLPADAPVVEALQKRRLAGSVSRY